MQRSVPDSLWMVASGPHTPSPQVLLLSTTVNSPEHPFGRWGEPSGESPPNSRTPMTGCGRPRGHSGRRRRPGGREAAAWYQRWFTLRSRARRRTGCREENDLRPSRMRTPEPPQQGHGALTLYESMYVRWGKWKREMNIRTHSLFSPSRKR